MDINDWRNCIDEVTDDLIALLNKRASFATEIGKIKQQKGLPIFDASREQVVLNVVGEKASKFGGPLSSESIQRIFQVIMEETRKVEG